ncbi:hypothetical protein [Teredinibacter franksiae]|uniref:hypothetical protein n=1 Tax=Teredinibacter franksiae TaxID=2761453 RepID=UPI001C89533B|nr:hypothetical protein [Teredinibacter franksiae]
MITAWMIILTITGSIGLALILVGVLMTLLTALGNKRYAYGVLIFLCFPAAFVYCIQHRSESGYPSRLLYPGAALALITALIAWGLYVYYGLEFAKR